MEKAQFSKLISMFIGQNKVKRSLETLFSLARHPTNNFVSFRFPSGKASVLRLALYSALLAIRRARVRELAVLISHQNFALPLDGASLVCRPAATQGILFPCDICLPYPSHPPWQGQQRRLADAPARERALDRRANEGKQNQAGAAISKCVFFVISGSFEIPSLIIHSIGFPPVV
ncbi:MAG: hypothetical protein AAFW66_16645 [Pseudomonadota bacterium]